MLQVHSKSLWSYNPLPTGCVLYLPLWSPGLNGSAFKSADPFRPDCTATATQVADGRLFVANHYVLIPASATQLNFTSGDFSIVMRVKPTDLSADNWLFDRAGAENGYFWFISAAGRMRFRTQQAGPVDQLTESGVGDIAINTGYTVGISRAGTSVKIYKNGVDTTQTSGTHIDPVTVSTTALIGIFSNLTSFDFIGTISDVAAWERSLSTAEHLVAHNAFRVRL